MATPVWGLGYATLCSTVGSDPLHLALEGILEYGIWRFLGLLSGLFFAVERPNRNICSGRSALRSDCGGGRREKKNMKSTTDSKSPRVFKIRNSILHILLKHKAVNTSLSPA